MGTQHTPTPWEMDTRQGDDAPYEVIYSASVDAEGQGVIVDTLNSHYLHSPDERRANAAFIVRACNAHVELLEALKDAADLVESWGAYAGDYFQEKHDLKGDVARLRAAIAKAEAL